jgi:hypothetical protein
MLSVNSDRDDPVLADRQTSPLVLEAGHSFRSGRCRCSRSASHIELDGPLGCKVPAVAGDVAEEEARMLFELAVCPHPPRDPASLLVMRTREDRFWNAEKSPGRSGECCRRNGRWPTEGREDRNPGMVVNHLPRAFTHFAECGSTTPPALRGRWRRLLQKVPGMASSFAGPAYSGAFTALASHRFLRRLSS